MNNSPHQQRYYTLPSISKSNAAFQLDARANNEIVRDANLTTNWNYRKYIQTNANNIMEYNTLSAFNNAGTNPYPQKTSAGTNTPHTFTSIHDTSENVRDEPISDLKASFLSNQRLKAKMIAPDISTKNF